VASWLFGVARRVAAKARTRAARRRRHERRAAARSPDGYIADDDRRDFTALHEEIDRLPEKFRGPVVLCYLEGISYELAASRLGVTEGAVRGRLARARGKLRSRLIRRGMTVPAGLLVAGVTSEAASAAVPTAVVESTVRSVMNISAGNGAIPGVASATVAGLAERTIWAMRLKTIGVGSFGIGILVLVVAASQAVGTRAREQVAQEQRTGTREDPPWTKGLPGGVKVELIGVSSHPAGPETWWSPDGSPLARAPYVRAGVRPHPDKDQQAREFAVRVEDGPEKNPPHRWEVIPSGSSASATPHDREGRVVPDVEMICVTIPRDRAKCKVRFGIATGEWVTQATDGPQGGSAHGREKVSVIFGGAHEAEGKTGITVSHNVLGDASRVVAIDQEGKEHLSGHTQSLGAGPIQQLENEYDVRLSRVKEFRFQSRPFQWAEFDDVALSPRSK
jgi:hypothetical protein